MTHINTPGEMECYQDQEMCNFELEVQVQAFSQGGCQILTGVIVNGFLYTLETPINIVNPGASSVADSIEAALDAYGLFGSVTETVQFVPPSTLEFNFTIVNSNAESVSLQFANCAKKFDFTKSEDCCEPSPPPAGDGGLAGPGNPDLFYEHITYNGLDISRIDMGSNCITGFMRNEYDYDNNHRLKHVRNTFFMPDPVLDLFSSNYTYDLAGNLLTLKRFGLEDPTVMGTTPVLIDDLDYGYNQGSKLNSVTDLTSLPQGFVPSTSTYDYDGAGNLDLRTDDGTELTIGYNLLNLPGTITHQTDGAIRYGYTYGGHKFLKTTELADEDEETRLYLGGAEFVEGQPESYYHGEGRVALTGSEPRFQYKLTDHLGNTMVLFEDRDEDGIITTESMSPDNPALVEVLQRNFYYAFGLPMQGPWNHTPADPDMPYLYNGKELEGELGLGWMDYGARCYDAAIGRWGGVDPLAHLYYGWSSYNYVLGNPISFVDPDGRSVETIIIGHRDNSGSSSVLVTYEADGNLYNRDGSLYDGDNIYLRSVQSTLNSMRSLDERVDMLVLDLVNGNERHSIQNFDPKLDGTPSEKNESYNIRSRDSNNPSGSLTKFVPEVDRVRLDDSMLTNEEILGHELKHAYNRKHNMQGKGYTENKVPLEEIDAVNFQNVIREKQGQKPRTTFAKKDISDYLVNPNDYNNFQQP